MQTITTPAIRTTPSQQSTRNTSQKQSSDIVISCTKIEETLRENFKLVFEHVDDEYFYNTTSRYVKQIGSDRWKSFNNDYLDVIVMLDGKSANTQTCNVKLKQTPVKTEPIKSTRDDKLKSDSSTYNSSKNVATTPQDVKSERIPSVKSAFASSSTVIKPEKTTTSKPQPPSKLENVKQQEKAIPQIKPEKIVPPSQKSIPQVKPEKVIPKQSPSQKPVPPPQVKPEKITPSSKSNNQHTNQSIPNIPRLNTSNSSIASPSKPKIKPAAPKKILTTPPIQQVQQSTSRNTVQQTSSMKKPQMMSAFSQDEEESTTTKRPRKWRKEHNDKLMEYFSNRPHLASNSFFESDRLMQQFIESYQDQFTLPLTIPTLAKRKYKYDQFFNAIMQATQTVIKAEKTNTNKRKDPPTNSSSAKRHKM